MFLNDGAMRRRPLHPLKAALTITLLASYAPSIQAGEGVASARSGVDNLSLSEVLRLALEQNREIAVERTAVEIQSVRIEGAYGAFDPELSLRTIAESRERAQNIREVAATDGISIFEQDNIFFQTGLTGRVPLGTRYEFTLNSDRLKNSLNARPDSRFRPEYDSDVALTLTQPLLRDAGRYVNRLQIFLTRGEREIAGHELRLKVLEIAGQVIQTYADLIYAQGNVQVRRDAVEVARTQREENQKRVELGVMKPLDVLQAEAAISLAEDELIRAEVFLNQRQNALKALVDRDYREVAEVTPFASDPLDTQMINADDLGYWIGLALRHNPEYQKELAKLGQEDMRIDYAENQLKPRVDLQGSLGYNGLSDGYGSSFEDFGDRDRPDWTAGVVVRIPLGNREAKARLREAQMRKTQVEDSIGFARNSVISALDSALDRVRASRRRHEAIGKTVELAAESLEEERSRLEEGLTTSYDVLEMQKELADARARRLAARTDIMKAIAEVHQISGRIPQLEDKLQLLFADDESDIFDR